MRVGISQHGYGKGYPGGGIRKPEEYLKRFAAHFKVDGSFAAAKTSLLSCLLAGLLAYHQLVILGNGNADAICEGLVYYTGSDWALACGRWATRYLSISSLNLVMPGIWVLLYMLTVFATVMMLAKLWGIRSRLGICLVSILMAVNPAVIEQSLLQYMFLCWGMSNMLGTAFVYLTFKGEYRAKRLLLAPLCMAVAFGFYQSSVGLICLCFGMTLILALLNGMEFRQAMTVLLRFILGSILGVALYFGIQHVEILRYGVEESGRVQLFSFQSIFQSLAQTIPQAYRAFWDYFRDYFFYRKLIYELLFAAGLALFAIHLGRRLREKAYGESALALLLLLLLPLLGNISKVLFPDNIVTSIMQYQSNFVVPFLFALLEGCRLKWDWMKNLGRIGALSATAVLFWGYLVSANATYSTYELSYRHINFMTASILQRVYEMPEYSSEDTIVFAGFIDDEELRSSIPAYKFAYGKYENPVFWVDAGSGLKQNRNNYLLNYFGFEGGEIRGLMHGAYNEAVQSDRFAEMEIYPGADSIEKFDNMIIVKLSEEPPLFD